MAFIGNQPTAVPLTSSQLADGLITTAKIATGAVENVDIASNTINLTQKVTGTLPTANGGTGLAALGTAGQALVVNSTATALEFATVGATAGQVIQVVSTAKTTPFTTTSTSFTDVTGLSVSITPASASNKILILVNFASSNSVGSRLQQYNLVRNSTDIAQPTSSGSSFAQYDSNSGELHNVAFHFLDSPSTTSSITYKIQAKTNNSDNTITIGDRGAGDLDVVSTITVMEIKG